MILTVNGVDIVPFIAEKGIKWTRSDIEAPNTGRTLDGTMQRGRVASKIRLDITCKPLSASDLATVMNAIYPVFVTVRYSDPLYGTRIVTMYSNNTPASYLMQRPNGEEYWSGITFPLIER